MNDNFYKMSFWQTNPVSKVFSFFLKAIHYQPPQAVRQFILAEKSPSVNEVKPIDTEEDAQKAALKNSGQILRDHLNYAQEFAGFLEDAICELKNNKPTGGQKINNEIYKLTQKKAELSLPLRSFDTSLPPEDRLVSSDLNENKNILEKLYHLPENSDLIFHFFAINSAPPEQAMLIFLDGMVNKEIIDLAILQPLTLFFAKSRTSQLTAGSIKNHLPNHILKTETSYQEISRAVNSGDTVLFLDGLNEAFILDSKGYEHRGVGKADIEKSLQGTQSAFTEVIQVNTSMLRSLLPTSDLVKESLTVGDRVETACAVMYLKSIANENLVKEVKRRLQGIRTDYLIDIGTLSQFIEEQPNAFFPKSLQTERPDRTALLLTEGRVAIFLNGAPFAMIVPVNFFTFFHFVEDYSTQVILSNFVRLIRFLGLAVSLSLSSLYIALSYFHPEAIPTKLAIAIEGYREKVPFPIIAELCAMEIAFEMIREAGLRVPGILGSTITIVGAIIIGQAAVTANLVSPIAVVLVSLTALASFATPDYRMESVFRMIRFTFIFLAYFLGLEGISIGIFLLLLYLSSIRSFGVPYFTPWGSKSFGDWDTVFKTEAFKKELRPGYFHPQDTVSQPDISREWDFKGKGEQEK